MTYNVERTNTFLLVHVTYRKCQTVGGCPRAAVTSVSRAALQITLSCFSTGADKNSCLSRETLLCNNPFDAHAN